MKIGLYYEDTKTGRLLKCVNFTYSMYCWLDENNNSIDYDKSEALKHINSVAVKPKKRINDFEKRLEVAKKQSN